MALNKYLYNKNLDVENYGHHVGRGVFINGQSLEPICRYRVGSQRFTEAGCGPIAIYNAIIGCQGYVALSDIIQDLEERKLGLLLDGKYGVNPWSMKACLKNYGYPVQFHWGKRIEKAVAHARCAIVLYTWRQGKEKGAHYITILKKGSVWSIYNLSNQSNQVYQTDHLEDYLALEGRVHLTMTLRP